jgi:hypothetical protein
VGFQQGIVYHTLRHICPIENKKQTRKTRKARIPAGCSFCYKLFFIALAKTLCYKSMAMVGRKTKFFASIALIACILSTLLSVCPCASDDYFPASDDADIVFADDCHSDECAAGNEESPSDANHCCCDLHCHFPLFFSGTASSSETNLFPTSRYAAGKNDIFVSPYLSRIKRPPKSYLFS